MVVSQTLRTRRLSSLLRSPPFSKPRAFTPFYPHRLSTSSVQNLPSFSLQPENSFLSLVTCPVGLLGRSSRAYRTLPSSLFSPATAKNRPLTCLSMHTAASTTVTTVLQAATTTRPEGQNVVPNAPTVVELRQPAEAADTVARPTAIYRKDYKPSPYTVKHVSMDFSLDYAATNVATDLYLLQHGGQPGIVDLVLDGEELELLDLSLTLLTPSEIEALNRYFKAPNTPAPPTGKPQKLSRERGDYKILEGKEQGKLWINGRLLPQTTETLFKLTTHVKIDPSRNLQLSGLYKAGELLCTQCEAEGFRRITYALDRPDILSTFKVRLEADAEVFPILLSNGNEIEKGTLQRKEGAALEDNAKLEDSAAVLERPTKAARQSHRHFAVFCDPFPKPCYLFAVVAGDLASQKDVFNLPPKEPVKLNLFCEPSEKDRLDWAMTSLKAAMLWDAKTYGLYYDLDVFSIVAVPNFNFGAMENKSLNIFNSAQLLCSKETSTDSEFMTIMSIVGHEYFHNYTGNRVTCRDWFQLTLKEGLTVYREQEFYASHWSRPVARIQDVQMLRAAQFPEDSGPLKHPIRPDSYISIDNFYTATVYEKGAEVIRMYETILGVEGFKKGLALYLTRNDGKAATCGDFRRAMADANEKNLDRMRTWYSTPGTPTVQLDSAPYDPVSRTFRFRLTQLSPKTAPLLIPVKAGLIGKTLLTDIVEPQVFELFSLEPQEYVFNNVNEECVLSALRNFSAPIRLIAPEETDSDLAFLLAHDSDTFNQWESGQKLAKRVILALAEKMSTTGGSASDFADLVPESFIRSVDTLLKPPTDVKDFQYQALLLCLPPESILFDEFKSACDPVTLYEARAYVKYRLAEAFRPRFQEIYDTLSLALKKDEEIHGYQVTCKDVGRRSYRNLCLSYLTARPPFATDDTSMDTLREAATLAFRQYESSTNMTDRRAALECLKDIPCDERTKALDSFHAFAKDNKSVMDTWFYIQSTSDVPSVFEDVQALAQHPDFQNTNANYLSSLWGGFSRNTRHFHRSDGKGYSLYADKVLEIDPSNSMVASRLVRRFSQWKKWSAAQQDLVMKQLNRVMQTPNISKECFEICSKTLEASSDVQKADNSLAA